jgi:hypothetical protein
MPRPTPAVEHAMEAQVALLALQRACGPLWETALASASWPLMAEAKALSGTLRTARLQLRRIAGQLDAIACPDGETAHGHGKAA